MCRLRVFLCGFTSLWHRTVAYEQYSPLIHCLFTELSTEMYCGQTLASYPQDLWIMWKTKIVISNLKFHLNVIYAAEDADFQILFRGFVHSR